MNKRNFFVGAAIILLVIAIAVISWLYSSLQQAQSAADQASQALEAQKQADVAQKEKDLEDELKITWPTRNSDLCYEQPYSVSWQAPVDMDAVTITLYTPSSSTRIGDYPAVTGTSDNIGYSSFQWYLTNAAGAVVEPSQAYKMTISGMYHGHEISTSTDGVFSVGNCN